jgi:putative ABC transport system permease protein
MLGFGALAAVTCMLLVGLLPAIRLSDVSLDSLLKSGAGTGAHRGNRVKYGFLVITQIGLTLPLVTGAVLVARGLWQYEDPDYRAGRMFGFDPDSVIVARMFLKVPRYEYVRVAPIAAAVVGRARAVSGVSEAGIAIPAQPMGAGLTVLDESDRSAEFATPSWSYWMVTPGYFRGADLPIERGRGFIEGEPAVIIDRATSVYLWPNQNPVGRSIKLGDARAAEPWLRVVGVRGDHLNPEGRKLRAWFDTLRVGNVFRSITETDSARAGYKGLQVVLYVRPASNPLLVVAKLRRALEGMTFTAPPLVFWGREEYGVSSTIIRRRFMASLFGGGALICLALSAFGVYAIVAQSVAQRRREIAVRIFLGATPRRILHLILREGNVFVLAGILAGLLITMKTVGWLGWMLLGETDSGTALYFAFACAFLFAVAALSALIPAATATLIDPAEALRAE